MYTPDSTICAACAECVVNPAVTAPHPLMTPEYDHHHPRDRLGYYRCLECETRWALHRDENGQPTGITKIPDGSCGCFISSGPNDSQPAMRLESIAKNSPHPPAHGPEGR